MSRNSIELETLQVTEEITIATIGDHERALGGRVRNFLIINVTRSSEDCSRFYKTHRHFHLHG